MENLFDRILKAVESLENNSQTAFAKKIGCQQSTFNGYMNEEGQRKIRLTLLEDILRAYPQVRRDWLYFGEGEMTEESTLQVATVPPCAVVKPVQVAVAPMQVAAQPVRTALASIAEEEAGELHALRKEVSALKDKLIATLEENTRLHERIHCLSGPPCGGDEDVQWGFQKAEDELATPVTAALGVPLGGK